jgi:hypothetical protein
MVSTWRRNKSLSGLVQAYLLRGKFARAMLFLLPLLMIVMQTRHETKTYRLQTQARMAAQTLDPSVEYNSDIVELDHCDLSTRQEILAETKDLLQMAMTDSQPALNQSLPALFHPEGSNAHNRTYDDYLTDMRDEYALQLLELKLMERAQCNFSLYRPTVHGHDLQGIQLQQAFTPLDQHQPSLWKPFRIVQTKPHRLAIVISAFKDFDHLVSLLEAVHLPQHYIVVHIDRHCDLGYKARLEALLAATPQYGNVVIVQFGSVVYRSDSISMINLRILRWLTFDLGLDYDHALLMDGLAYPLRSPQEMVDYLRVQSTQHNRTVWMGLMHTDYFDFSSGQRPPANAGGLHNTVLLFTRNNQFKIFKPHLYEKELPDYIRNLFMFKSNSGNQAVYSRTVVEKLLTSDIVMELFAWSKYSCCCCMEEYNWMAALEAIGFADDAITFTSMFQAWGGGKTCEWAMSNAVLTADSSLFYVSFDPFHYDKVLKSPNRQSKSPDAFCFSGNETISLMADAKKRGAMFARKFQSHETSSVALMELVRTQLWQ